MNKIAKFTLEPFMRWSLIFMSVLAFVQVLTRYVFHVPAVWVEEIARYLMVWMVFIGMAYAIPKNAHFMVEIIELILPRKVWETMYLIMDFIMLAFAVIFSGLCWKVVTFQFELGQVSTAAGLPMGFVYCGMLIGGILLVLFLIERIYKKIKAINLNDLGEGA